MYLSISRGSEKQAPHLMSERFKDLIVSAILSGKAGREIGTVKTVLNQTKATWDVVATQGRGQLCSWDGCQAGFLEEVTLGRALKQVITKSQM